MEPYLIYGVIKGLMYAVLGLGFSLIYKSTKIFHFAYGLVYISASYFLFLFLNELKFGILIATPFAVLLASFISIIIEKFLYWPLKIKNAPMGVFLISSLGVYIIGINLIALIFGSDTKILASGTITTYKLHNTSLSRIQIYQFFVSIIILVLFFSFFKKFKIGKLISALSSNAELFRVFGWDEKKIRVIIFIVSSSLAAMISILNSFDMGMNPNSGMNALLIGAVVMIIGGIDNFLYIVSAGFCLAIVQNLIVWLTSSRWEQAITFIILILFLVIFGKRMTERTKRIEEV